MVTASAFWVRTAGIVNATLAGEGQAATLPWRSPATTTKTTKEVRINFSPQLGGNPEKHSNHTARHVSVEEFDEVLLHTHSAMR